MLILYLTLSWYILYIGLTLDVSGNLYVADTYNNVVRRMSLSSSTSSATFNPTKSSDNDNAVISFSTTTSNGSSIDGVGGGIGAFLFVLLLIIVLRSAAQMWKVHTSHYISHHINHITSHISSQCITTFSFHAATVPCCYHTTTTEPLLWNHHTTFSLSKSELFLIPYFSCLLGRYRYWVGPPMTLLS